MATFQELLNAHQAEADKIVENNVASYRQSGEENTNERLAQFMIENEKSVRDGITKSAMHVNDQLISSGVTVTDEHYDAIRSINLDADHKWQHEMTKLYDEIVDPNKG